MLKLVGNKIKNGNIGGQIEILSKSKKLAKLVKIGKWAKFKKSSKIEKLTYIKKTE